MYCLSADSLSWNCSKLFFAMIQSTITHYFRKNIENNVKKEVDMNLEEEMSINIKKDMDVEVKGELVLDWDEVDNCYGKYAQMNK